MAIIVEHDKRKHEILEKALDVFIEEGYEDVTFQKIADRCGITRTTLYIYFKNKRDIFLWSIKQLLSELETAIMKIINDKSLNAETCFRAMLMKIVDSIEEHKKLFNVLLIYLIQLQKSGIDSRERVVRRVIKLRHVMTDVLIRGMKSGEFKQLNVKEANALFYSLIEAAIFRLAVFTQKNTDDSRTTFNLAVDGILNQ
ncbi:MAG: TetR/AcrR family transcriptional regulator [Treponema sp.]|nr:TetR/AcrR family transcriptional regulator [Treponema sp.]